MFKTMQNLLPKHPVPSATDNKYQKVQRIGHYGKTNLDPFTIHLKLQIDCPAEMPGGNARQRIILLQQMRMNFRRIFPAYLFFLVLILSDVSRAERGSAPGGGGSKTITISNPTITLVLEYGNKASISSLL